MFDFFKKKKKLELEDQSVINVHFSVDPFGEVDINMDWISDEDAISMLLATLLSNINSGNYSTAIVDILTKSMQEDEKYKPFISKTLANWKNITALQTSKELPVVRPSDFSYGINKDEQ